VPEWLQIVLLTLLAGGAIPLGAVAACFEGLLPGWLDREFRHTVIAFGAGALLSAVALVLVPEGIAVLSVPWVVACFGGGGVAFMLLDRRLARSKTRASQMVAMLSDFIPEAIALGAAFVSNAATAKLLALVMALQNLPEGFNAYREILDGGPVRRRGRMLAVFAALALLGPVCGLAGYHLLSDLPQVVAGVMLFGAGGIVYLVMQDLAPQARLERHWGPPLGAVAGFLLGVLGHMWVG